MTTITRYVDVFCSYDGEPANSDAYDSLNDAISNMWDQEWDNWEIWDDEKRPLASNHARVEGNIIDQKHWNTYTLRHCIKARNTKIYFRKLDDLKHFEATLDTEEEREIS